MTFTNHCLLYNAGQFADDTIAYLTIYSELDSGILQNDLEKLKRGGPKRQSLLHECTLYGQTLF